MQAQLDAGASIAALRRFSDNLAKLPEQGWGKCACLALPCNKHISKL